MVLNGDYRQFLVSYPFHSSIVQVEVTYAETILQGSEIDSVAVVLSRDVYAPCVDVADRVVATAMSEFELEGASTEGTTDELLSQTDAHEGLQADDLLERVYKVAQKRRITRTWRHQDSIRSQPKNPVSGMGTGDDSHPASLAPEKAEDIVFDAAVHDHNVEFRRAGHRVRLPLIRAAGADLLNEVDMIITRQCFQSFQDFSGRKVAGYGTHHYSAGTKMSGQSPGIDAVYARHSTFGQILMEGGPAQPVTRLRAVFTNDKATHLEARRLNVPIIYAVVAHQGIGGHQNLTGVGGIGQHLLIASHAGVEDDLAIGESFSAEGLAFVYGTIFEDEYRRAAHLPSPFPDSRLIGTASSLILSAL